MHHPFGKMLYKALAKSTSENNAVLVEAEKLREKGYAVEEIYTLLVALRQGLIDPKDSEIAEEAVEEFEQYRR